MRLVPSNIGVAGRMTMRSGSVPVTLLTNALRARFPCEIRDRGRVQPFLSHTAEALQANEQRC